MSLQIRLLGPLEVIRDEEKLALGGPRVRAVVAVLALSANRVVTDDQLIDSIWGEDAPANASKVLQNCVLRARKAIGSEFIERRPAGYELVTDAVTIDLLRVEERYRDGRSELQAGRPGRAAELFEQALQEWRGPALSELSALPLALTEMPRLAELRLTIAENLIDARLELGHHDELLSELARLTAEEPLRERFWMQRMLALYRSGRQHDALAAYQELRALLDEQLGLRPSPEASELQQAILAQAAELSPQTATLPTGIVTFLMTDIEGSTRLLYELGDDYEAALALHHSVVRRVVASHGGHEISTTGDGLLSAFADPAAGAAAAVAAQRELRRSPWPAGREVRVRMGIHTGPAAPTPEGDYISIAVNEVARVCDAGHGGQILLSGDAVRLIDERLPRDCELVHRGKFQLKGFAEPVALSELCAPDLGGVFPVLRASAAGHNLPRERTELIGRERELAEVASLISDYDLVTILGPGGVGKTRMLLATASATRSVYPDGVWLISLGALDDPNLIPERMAEALGLLEQPQMPVLDSVLERLEEADLLLLFDNCEHLLDPAAEVVGMVLERCPKVKVLATSREPLALPSEAVYPLPPLPVPDFSTPRRPDDLLASEAVRLFVDRAGQARRDFAVNESNAHHVAEICRALDGLPLALELAAPLVRQMPLDELARRVREQVLMPASGRGRDTRHATVRAAIEWSHRLLEPAQRVWFERLGVFSGGFTLTAAERLCGIVSGGEEDMVALLSGLVDKSLLALEERAGGFRYRMLGTIRRFALEQLSSRADEAQVRGAHLEVFAELVRTLDPQLTREHAERFEALDLEQDNFRAALTWAEGQPEQADRFAALATALVPLWRLRAQLAEGRRWLASAAERATQEPLRAAAGLGEGSCALLQGDYAHAGGVLTEALKRYEELGDVQGAARCLHALGQVEAYRGHHERADAHFDEAVKKLTLVGHAGGLAEVHHEIGRFARFRGDYAMARENLERSLALCEDLGDVRGRADALHELGRVARRRGEPEAAGERLGSALRLYSELGDRRGIAKSNYALGSLAQESGDLELAGRHFNDAVNSFREVGDRQGLAWPLRGLGMIASARQELDEAQALFQEMLAIGQAIDSDPVIMSALAALGDLAEARGDVEAAAKLLRDALDVGGRVGYEPELRLLRERIANLVQT